MVQAPVESVVVAKLGVTGPDAGTSATVSPGPPLSAPPPSPRRTLPLTHVVPPGGVGATVAVAVGVAVEPDCGSARKAGSAHPGTSVIVSVQVSRPPTVQFSRTI